MNRETAERCTTLRGLVASTVHALNVNDGIEDRDEWTSASLFSDPSFFDPSGRSATMRLAQPTLQELVIAEETLLALYDKHLPAIGIGADAR